ncbi:hypothetical protein X970_12750 [Pseudomonas monteilii SB3101]|uniref:Uncharacterized protein n=2 Tax=Pseudomonas TaxID=286 RepID=V9VB27_9PSED|nr:hypothetical protein X969_13105 [Pseudomonas monteilii SB3078]AHC91110.1 hypothetical protein X970_12750 [Pseudomonas monteilii SB3101]ESW36336.1 hypothetical protein O164_30470 [Pseudomonas taiwanensis SJ9]KGK25839.1 hypothetical protein GT93_13765 [Pseudomonas plecoglossicida]KGK25906.1 hypothetical protein GT93_14110 [Pseudomonas plecoglossicida]
MQDFPLLNLFVSIQFLADALLQLGGLCGLTDGWTGWRCSTTNLVADYCHLAQSFGLEKFLKPVLKKVLKDVLKEVLAEKKHKTCATLSDRRNSQGHLRSRYSNWFPLPRTGSMGRDC